MIVNTPHRPRIVARAQRLWPPPPRRARSDVHYTFEGVGGQRSLAELFGGRGRLIVRHLVLGCGDPACVGCDALAGLIDPEHLASSHPELSLVVVSHAPLSEIEAFKRRFGIKIEWLSSYGTDFNRDYHAAAAALAGGMPTGLDRPGVSTFYVDDAGSVVHAASCYLPALDVLSRAEEWLRFAPIPEPGGAR